MKKFEEWCIAYRKKDGNQIMLDDLSKPFQMIKNTWRYWAADPHVYEYENSVYVFAELYDRVLRKGVIGYCQITNQGVTSWKKVIERPWHLSYPHIFENNNQIYMIPESYVGEQIELLKAIKFPDKWKSEKVLKNNIVAVDSTIINCDEIDYLQTLQFDNDKSYLRLFKIENMELSKDSIIIAEDDPNKRPAGHIFRYHNSLVRPAQDCTESYGCAINFYNIKNISDNDYDEELLKKIYPADIVSNFKYIPKGIHTYNFSENYEVIDLKYYERDYLFYVVRPIWYIWRKIKKVLRNDKHV